MDEFDLISWRRLDDDGEPIATGVAMLAPTELFAKQDFERQGDVSRTPHAISE